MKNFKRALAIMLALVMVLSLAACGKKTTTDGDKNKGDAADSASETLKFEVVSKGFQSTYWQAVYKGFQEEVKKIESDKNVKIDYNFVGPDSETDIAQQVQQFESAVNANPDALGLAALDVDALNDSIGKVNGKTPIIGFDSGVPDAPEGAVLANASTDNYAAGEVAAENLYEKIKSRIGDKQVRIGEVNQDATSESITNRGLGFIDKMIELLTADNYTVCVTGNEKYVGDAEDSTADEASANVIIEVRVPAQTTTELCATEAGVILNKEDTIAIFGSNQVAAEGVVTANDSLSVCGSEDTNIIAVGFDSGSVLKAAVSSGVMYGAVTQAPVTIGAVLADLMYSSAKGEEVEDTDTGCQFYTVENIESEEIAQNLYD